MYGLKPIPFTKNKVFGTILACLGAIARMNPSASLVAWRLSTNARPNQSTKIK
jgi:hypothetical protein